MYNIPKNKYEPMCFCVYNNNGNSLDVYYIIYVVYIYCVSARRSTLTLNRILYYRNDEIYDFFVGVSLLPIITRVII